MSPDVHPDPAALERALEDSAQLLEEDPDAELLLAVLRCQDTYDVDVYVTRAEARELLDEMLAAGFDIREDTLAELSRLLEDPKDNMDGPVTDFRSLSRDSFTD